MSWSSAAQLNQRSVFFTLKARNSIFVFTTWSSSLWSSCSNILHHWHHKKLPDYSISYKNKYKTSKRCSHNAYHASIDDHILSNIFYRKHLLVRLLKFGTVSKKYLVTISCSSRGTTTGDFLLFLYRNCRILSIASASLAKSNSYPILNSKKQKIYI